MERSSGFALSEDFRSGLATDRGVQELDHMEGRESRLAAAAKAGHELKKASRVGRDDGFGTSLEQVGSLTIA